MTPDLIRLSTISFLLNQLEFHILLSTVNRQHLQFYYSAVWSLCLALQAAKLIIVWQFAAEFLENISNSVLIFLSHSAISLIDPWLCRSDRGNSPPEFLRFDVILWSPYCPDQIVCPCLSCLESLSQFVITPDGNFASSNLKFHTSHESPRGCLRHDKVSSSVSVTGLKWPWWDC